jgi:L-fucose mutarotase/ribose pyranase (RbsD/FucU family)
MGHGDRLCIADGNFPSDAVAAAGKDGKCIGTPIRVFGVTTVDLLADILQLLPIDSYCEDPVIMMVDLYIARFVTSNVICIVRVL